MQSWSPRRQVLAAHRGWQTPPIAATNGRTLYPHMYPHVSKLYPHAALGSTEGVPHMCTVKGQGTELQNSEELRNRAKYAFGACWTQSVAQWTHRKPSVEEVAKDQTLQPVTSIFAFCTQPTNCGWRCSELWKGRSKLLYGGARFLSLSPPALHTIINTVWIRLLFKFLSTVLNFRHVGPA